MQILERVIEVKAADNDKDKDLGIWRWLMKVLARYGSDGMSSDETETDGSEIVYRVKMLIWRRNVDEYIDMIDNERTLAKEIFSGSGAKPTPRTRSAGNPISTHHAPKGLPIALLDPDWLEEVNGDYRQLMLSVSKDDFPWISFTPEQRTRK